MGSSSTGRCIPHKSKKRVFPGSSSEISSPPDNRTLKGKNKMLKQNEDAMAMISSGPSSAIQHHLIDGVRSSKKVKSHEKGKGAIQLDSVEGVSYSYNGKDYMDLYADDYVSEDEWYTIFQSHFDNIDLPTGIEAPIPGFSELFKMKNKKTSAMQASHKHELERLPLMSSAESSKGTQRSVGRSSSTWSSRQAQRDAMKVRSVKKPLKAMLHNISYGSGGSSFHNRHDQLGSLKVPGTRPYFPHDSTTQVGGGTSSSVPQLPTVGAPEHGHIIPMEDVTLDQASGKSQKSLNIAGSSSSMEQPGGDDDVLRKYQNFKKFDIVEDHSDHHFSALLSAMMQPPRNWAKKIQEEWRILKKGLPDMIFVRVYESRMDLLRAVIVGAEGTPYHDGLFFFDVCFPSNYPNSPPQVHYHSGGLHINPNLYRSGKVCLSLLNTWVGDKNEKWMPGSSTMLQVLVSIQGLILNAKPYFNEPGFAHSSGSVDGEKQSLLYNERTLVLSLKTMTYTMKQPPKHFEDLVIGHFRDRAHGILTTCKAYTQGVDVGCVVRKDVETLSRRFMKDVERYMKTLAGAFKQIGAKDVEEFVPVSGPVPLTQKIRAFFGI